MNKSYSYLVPLFNTKCKLDKDYLILLDNVYTIYNDESGYIVIAYLKYDSAEYNEYLQKLHTNELFIESFDDDTTYYMVFKFPDEFKIEYDLFSNGAYSMFGETSKGIILSYLLELHKLNGSEAVRQVLYKDPKLKERIETKLGVILYNDMELSSKPDITKETIYNRKYDN